MTVEQDRLRRWGDLGKRTASAVVMVVLALATTRRGGAPFLMFWLAASFAILWEWHRLVGGAHLLARCAAGGVTLVLLALSVEQSDAAMSLLILLAGAALAALLAGARTRVWASSGVVYAGLLLVAVTGLRGSFPFGSRAIIWLFATVWATDCFAYFGGRLFGGPKLWPRISPSKTWSGTVTGIVVGGALGAYIALRDLPEPHGLLPILILSFAAAALSQVGDAFESGIKRHFGVKDSSWLIPGHGGVMDRLDGFVAAAIFAFAVCGIRNVPSIAGGLFYWT